MPIHLIYGTDDDDFILGTTRRDLILAGSGNDRITTVGGHDTTFGDDGNDTVFAYFGGDEVYGGAGDDYLVSSSFQTDRIGRLFGGAGNDRIFAGDLGSRSHGGAGDDTISVFLRGEGSSADGGAGMTHWRSAFLPCPPKTVWSPLQPARIGGAGGRHHVCHQRIRGDRFTTREGDDYVRGGAWPTGSIWAAVANVALGLAGDDFITCRAGAANFLDGGSGEDSLLLVQWQRDMALTLDVTGTTGVDNLGSHLTDFEHWRFMAGRGAMRRSLATRRISSLVVRGRTLAVAGVATTF